MVITILWIRNNNFVVQNWTRIRMCGGDFCLCFKMIIVRNVVDAVLVLILHEEWIRGCALAALLASTGATSAAFSSSSSESSSSQKRMTQSPPRPSTVENGSDLRRKNTNQDSLFNKKRSSPSRWSTLSSSSYLIVGEAIQNRDNNSLYRLK